MGQDLWVGWVPSRNEQSPVRRLESGAREDQRTRYVSEKVDETVENIPGAHEKTEEVFPTKRSSRPFKRMKQ